MFMPPQLAAAVLTELQLPPDDVQDAIQAFRRNHISELQELCRAAGSSLGYGFAGTKDLDEVLPDAVAAAATAGNLDSPLVIMPAVP